MKFVAALQAAQSCARPVLLRADEGGGHFGNYTRNAADALAFAARELALPAPRRVR